MYTSRKRWYPALRYQPPGNGHKIQKGKTTSSELGTCDEQVQCGKVPSPDQDMVVAESVRKESLICRSVDGRPAKDVFVVSLALLETEECLVDDDQRLEAGRFR